MLGRNDDLFKLAVDFKTDIYFTELGKIKSHLVHALSENIDVCVAVYSRQKIEKSSRSAYFNNAGFFFNTMNMMSTTNQITDEELLKIASSMKTSLCEDKYSTLCQESDPVKVMKQFTKYFYVPVRVAYNTIPELVQTNLLKSFLITIIVLMFLDQYVSKFNETIPVLDVYTMCIEQYFQSNNQKIINGIKILPWKRIDAYLHQPVKKDNRTGCYFYGMNKIIGTICMEIVNKFCPNYQQVKSINPKYNGEWESPFDDDIAEQVRTLLKISN